MRLDINYSWFELLMLIYNNKTWFHQSERWGDTNIFFIECDTGKIFIQIDLFPQYLFLVLEKKWGIIWTLPTHTQFLLLKLIKLLLNTVVGDNINTIKTTFLFKFWLLKSFFYLQLTKEKLFNWQVLLTSKLKLKS